MRDSAFLAARVVKAKPLKTFLSVLGIIIGVASVVCILCIGGGGQAAVMKQLEQFGINTISIKPTTEGGQTLDLEDYEFLKEYIPASMTPVYVNYGSVQVKNQKRDVMLWGVDREFSDLLPVHLKQGRVFSQVEYERGKACGLVEESVAQDLFGADPIGKVMEISTAKSTLKVTVTGVIEDAASSLGDTFESSIPTFVYMPTEAVLRHFGDSNLDYISMKTQEESGSSEGIRAVKLLNRKNGDEGYYAEDMTRQRDLLGSILHIITWIISAVAAVSLVVGGIGIMNLMLVSVSERTAEIGMMKAIGAKKSDIMAQFLMEAALITILGAAGGAAAGISLGFAVTRLANMPFVLDFRYVVGIVVFVAAVGLIFGVYPAKKAADLRPVEALR